MLNFKSLLIFSENPKKLAEFYAEVFDMEIEWNDGEWFGFTIGTGSIGIGPHSEVKGKNKNPERIMFNLYTDDVEGEFVRIKALGVKVIAEPYQPMQGMWIATFADIDGNYFQLESPWDMEMEVKKTPDLLVN